MFTQCPECKTIFGFNEETSKIASGKVRCSQCSHVFIATEHLLQELPKVVGASTTSTPATEPESPLEQENTPAESTTAEHVTPEIKVATSEPEETDDDSFSLLDLENEFMESISDDYEHIEAPSLPEIDESLLRNAETIEETETAEPSETITDETAVEEPQAKTEESSADDLAAEWASMLGEEEAVEQPDESPPEEPAAEETDDLASEWASMLAEEEAKISNDDTSTIEAAMSGQTSTPVTGEEEATADDLASEWESMLSEQETTESPDNITDESATETSSTEMEEGSAEDLATEWESMLGDEETSEQPAAPPETTGTEEPESEMAEETELGANSSLQDFVQSQLEDLEDDHKSEEALALDISLHENAPLSEIKPAESEDEYVPAAIINDLQAAEESEQSWGKTLAWVMGILSLLVLLTGQYIHASRTTLAQIASVRPAIVMFCKYLDCDVPLYSNLSELEFVSQDVRTHPRYNNALYISVVFINKSRFYQAFPVIEFKLSDINQKPVAGRYFLPNAYTDKSINILEGIKPNVPVHAILEINDPGTHAVNYDFEFR